MAKKNDLETRINELGERYAELASACARLAAHAEVIGVAVRSREAVPADDLDDAIDGLREVNGELLRRS